METVDGVPDEFLEAAKKAMDAEQFEGFETQVRAIYKQMVRIAIRPEWARFYDFGAGRVPEFLRRLVENA